MIPYSLHVALILGLCLVFYRLLLYKETYFRLNRIVLLFCMLMAFVLPLVPVPQDYSLRQSDELGSVELPLAQPTESLKSGLANPIPQIVASQPIQGSLKAQVPLSTRMLNWVFWIYWAGVAVFGVNLFVQMVVLIYQAYRGSAIKDGIFRIVELDGDKAPCSFGNTIFINPEKYDWETYSQILIHEKVHIQQGHSFDLLVAEVMLVFQWFNPFAWMYRKTLESNLEFLTDDSVLHDHDVAMEHYQLSLLKVAVPNRSMNITTNYNQSLLKKRMMMMNAKKSNVHAMWKYFILLPITVIMVCGLNKPMAMSSSTIGNTTMMSLAKGLWFATIKDNNVQIEFKSDDYIDRNYRWSNSALFSTSEFSNLPKDNKEDFTVKREAGTVTFTGKFDGDQGFGRFKFTPDKAYIKFLEFKGIDNLKDEEYVSFFMMDVKRSYIQFLNDNGFKNLSKNQIISMSAFKVDGEYINYWKKIGYADITASNLVSLKSMKIDSAYVNDIRKAGYTDLTIQQLISFKSQKITGSYINSLQRATLKKPVSGSAETTVKAEKPTPTEIIRAKSLKVDTMYMAAVRDAGFEYLRSSTISALKNQNITPEFIKSFQDIGLRNLTTSQLYTLKSQGITPYLIRSYQEIGLTDLSTNTIYSLKSQGITAAFIKGFHDIGLKDMPINTFYTLRSQGITPAYIKSFHDIGLREVPYSTLYTFKTQGITPEFIKGFTELGYRNIPYTQYYALKTKGITPAYIADMKKK
ncbi:MAG: M56 family metallopeptidase, partial [Bacteroidia bacterium]